MEKHSSTSKYIGYVQDGPNKGEYRSCEWRILELFTPTEVSARFDPFAPFENTVTNKHTYEWNGEGWKWIR